MSVSQFGSSTGRNSDTIRRLAEDNGIPVERHRFGNKPADSLSQEAQERLLALPELQAKKAPEGYVSIDVFGQSVGRDPITIRRLSEDNGIPLGRHRFRSHTNDSISPEAQKRLLALPELQVEKAPESYVSVKTFADYLGLGTGTLRKLAETNAVPLGRHKFGAAGKVGDSLSPEAQQRLRELIARRPTKAPEDYMSIPDFAQTRGRSQESIRRLIKNNDIPLERHTFGSIGKVGVSLSPGAQQRLIELIEQQS